MFFRNIPHSRKASIPARFRQDRVTEKFELVLAAHALQQPILAIGMNR